MSRFASAADSGPHRNDDLAAISPSIEMAAVRLHLDDSLDQENITTAVSSEERNSAHGLHGDVSYELDEPEDDDAEPTTHVASLGSKRAPELRSLLEEQRSNAPYVEVRDLMNTNGIHMLSRLALSKRFDTSLDGAVPRMVTIAKEQQATLSSVPEDTEVPGPTITGVGEGKTEPMAETGDFNPRQRALQRLTERHETRPQNSIDDLNLQQLAGLSQSEHAQRLEEFGPNVVKPMKMTPLWLRYLLLYLQPFMLVLFLGVFFAFLMYGLDTSDDENLKIGIVLILVIILSVTGEFYQEVKSQSTMSAFSALVPKQAMVIRGGRRVLVSADSLVPGDVVVLRTGDQAAADIRLFHVNGLKIDTSAVTGEAEPVLCSAFYNGADATEMSPEAFDEYESRIGDLYNIARRAMNSPDDGEADVKMQRRAMDKPLSPVEAEALKAFNMPLSEARNIVFAGCSVLEGDGVGVVFATADRSMVGQIIQLTTNVASKVSLLQAEIIRLIKILGISAFLQVLLIFVICVARGDRFDAGLTQALIAVIVANIPQGLPTVVTTSMTVIASRMIDQKVYVKQLANIETLGCATVIASDKTGTLTQNKMTVTRVWVDGNVMTPREAFEKAHPSAVFTRFDPLAYTNAQYQESSDRNGQIARSESHMQKLENLLTRVSDLSMNEASRTHNSVAILDVICAVCNQTRYEDESSTAMPQELEADEKEGAVKATPARIMSYVRKSWVEREDERARATQQQEGRKAIGEPSDLAIFNYVAARQSIELLRYKLPVRYHLPFNSSNKFMLTAVDYVGPSVPQDRLLVLMKGAPEIVLSRCRYFHHEGLRFYKDTEFEKRFTEQYTKFAADGERVIACAYLEMAIPEAKQGSVLDTAYVNATPGKGMPTPGEAITEPMPNAPLHWTEKTFPTEGFTFVGLLSLADPPKETAPGALKAVREAGVKVIMVTGDHPLTAKAIARQVGIITLPTLDEVKDQGEIKPELRPRLVRDGGCGAVVEMEEDVDEEGKAAPKAPQLALVATGADIRSWTEEDWMERLSYPEIVFARTTPQQKLEIVDHLQRQGHIVCVTGDGVNDSPALRKAHIGIAMGISGSDVARDAADIILLDDDFSSIVAGIKEGRLLFANLAKVVVYLLTHLWAEVAPALATTIFGIPLGLSSMGVCAIDCGTEFAPSVSLACENPEDDLMKQPPRDTKRDRLVTTRLLLYAYAFQGVIMAMICFMGYFLTFWLNDVPISFLISSKNYFVQGAPPITSSSGKLLDANDQLNILADVQATYFMVLVLSQVGHIFLCRTRISPVWEVPFFGNRQVIIGVLIELVLMFAFLMIPKVNFDGFGFGTAPSYAYIVPFIGWVAYTLFAEGSKWARRNYPNARVTKYLGF